MTERIISYNKEFDNHCEFWHDHNYFWGDDGHNYAAFPGTCFDVTRMTMPPKKRKNKKTQKSVSASSLVSKGGYSNTPLSISHLSVTRKHFENWFNTVSNSESSPCDEFRVPETATVSELYEYFRNGERKQGLQLYFSDLSVYETLNLQSPDVGPYFNTSEGVNLPPWKHMQHYDKYVNIWGPFLGFDKGQSKHFGTWDQDLWATYMPCFKKANDLHQAKRCPIVFQYAKDSEFWSFRCAGYKERSSLGFPSERDLPFVYVLERGGVRIYMVPPELHDNLKVPAVVVVIDPEALRNCVPLSEVLKLALDFLAQFGFNEDTTQRKITRFDIQVTTDRCTVQDIRRAYLRGRVVCLARRFADIHQMSEDPTEYSGHGTLQFGTRGGPVFCRIYDKQAELQQTCSKDRGRTALYYCGCLGTKVDVTRVPLTRFEFECKGKFIEQFEIKDYEDLEKKLPSILAYLCVEWFRVLEHRKGNNHSSRVKTDDLWALISEVFISLGYYYASRSGGEITVTRMTKEEREYLNPDWPKTPKSASDMMVRAFGEFLLALGATDGVQVDRKCLNDVAILELMRRWRDVREYVQSRGAGYVKDRRFYVPLSGRYLKITDIKPDFNQESVSSID